MHMNFLIVAIAEIQNSYFISNVFEIDMILVNIFYKNGEIKTILLSNFFLFILTVTKIYF